MTNDEKLDALKMHCAKEDEGRAVLCKPFRNGEYTCSSDGYTGIQFAGDLGITSVENAPNISKLIDESKNRVVEMVDFVNLLGPEKFEDCGECNGTGIMKTCPNCEDGELTFTDDYNNDYEVECKLCDGSGTLYADSKIGEDIDCCTCLGTGKRPVENLIKIGNKSYNDFVLRRFEKLPNVKISIDEAIAYGAYISFDGGDGICMPLMKPRT